jgi:hypothetical protein
MNLEDAVFATIKIMMDTDTLFTALDISNAVKGILPQARHGEVRDIVRGLFTTEMVPAGWDRTSIEVTLADGSKQIALLYHPISLAMDIDYLYNDQRRLQTSVKVPQTNPVAATVAGDGTVSIKSSNQLPVPAPVVAQANPATRDLWKNMFSSQPSLFPRK